MATGVGRLHNASQSVFSDGSTHERLTIIAIHACVPNTHIFLTNGRLQLKLLFISSKLPIGQETG